MKQKISNRAKSALATAGYPVNEASPITQLIAFAAQNSGIDSRNYATPGDPNRHAWRDGWRAFQQESRSISKDWIRVKAALIEAAVDGVKDVDVIDASRRAFSGRLEWKTDRWEYCTGQYFPTEYRKAAAAVLEQAAHVARGNRPPTVEPLTSIADLQRLNRQNGGCWFGKSEMRFFGTRIESGIIAGHYFITSEQPPHGARVYSLRSFDEKGSVDTVGDFAKHSCKADVLAALAKLQNQKAAA